jgi:hypothetical protein
MKFEVGLVPLNRPALCRMWELDALKALPLITAGLININVLPAKT